jgi:diaminohydroxyphosphoribosylaminopyrimidine deaminase/5-amino-6-(5-phosphoribosylamino)uracil reductase
VHALRASRDAIVAGTGTVLIDDPHLTVRLPSGRMPLGSVPDAQPLRVVVGLRDVPASARVHDGPGEVLHVRTHEPHEVLDALWDRGVRDVWLEGGPTLAAAFLTAGLVDEVYAYLAPALLGAGRPAVADLGITSMNQISRFDVVDVRQVGGDVRIHVLPTK